MAELGKTETIAREVDQMVDTILGDSYKDFDAYMATVTSLFIGNKEILTADLNRIIGETTSRMWGLIPITQMIEMRKGAAKEQASYELNEALLKATGKTVSEKQAQAENQTLANRVEQLAYTTANSIVQAKVNAAKEIVYAAKKILDARMAEADLTRCQGSSVSTF